LNTLQRLLVLVLLAAAASPVAAQGLGFTVQVIAVSDQATALDLTRGLIRDGFPAYVVRSTGAQGDVYRVRVGAFANRAAAARYASAMPDVGGARPVPALAEGIPESIMPWSPRVVWQAPVADGSVRMLPWPSGLALRQQQTDPMRQAQYTIWQGDEVRTVDAWWLVPLAARPDAPSTAATVIDVPLVDLREGAAAPAPPAADTRGNADAAAPEEPVLAGTEADAAPEVALLMLRERALWPPAAEGVDDAVRGAFLAASVRAVALRLGLAEDRVQQAVRAGEPPVLMVVEVADRLARDAGDVRGVADPNAGVRESGGPPLEGSGLGWWVPVSLGEGVNTSDTDATLRWPWGETAAWISDGVFTLLEDGGVATRVMAGVPVWQSGAHLLLRDGDQLLWVYFERR
jgi:hypothetical protein